MTRLPLMGLSISTGAYHQFVDTIMQQAIEGRWSYTCIANVHMLMEAHRNRSFAQVVNGAAVVTPDGMPLTWALRHLRGMKQERVAGMDLLPDLLQQAQMQQLPVFFYGGQEVLLQQLQRYLEVHYPGLPVAGMHSPPFRRLSPAEDAAVVHRINTSGARLVFVVLGCPKQEQWMAAMQGRINAVLVGVGGAVPVLVGAQRRAPVWMQRSGLEWAYRLAQEPRRLWKRYVSTNTRFMLLFAKAYLQNKKQTYISGR